MTGAARRRFPATSTVSMDRFLPLLCFASRNAYDAPIPVTHCWHGMSAVLSRMRLIVSWISNVTTSNPARARSAMDLRRQQPGSFPRRSVKVEKRVGDRPRVAGALGRHPRLCLRLSSYLAHNVARVSVLLSVELRTRDLDSCSDARDSVCSVPVRQSVTLGDGGGG